MKRFLILVLGVFCAFALFVGCNSNDSSDNRSGGNQNAEDNHWTSNF
ncbi:MAG: hypothetical protein IJX91_02320 [Clostridia bacterium]|nr:hypothetical protein [Clostridia bacterium]